MPDLLIDKLKERVERLRRIHRHALEAFHAYEEILEYRNRLTLGAEVAHQHAEDIGRYKGFMVPVERGLNMKLHIELAKLLVAYPDALHIPKLISFAKQSQRQILASSSEVDIDGNAYVGLTTAEWQALEEKLVVVQPAVLRLKTVRDKQVAHENLNHPEEYDYNTYENLIELIQLCENILNTISVKFYGNIAELRNYKAQIINDTRALLRLISDSHT